MALARLETLRVADTDILMLEFFGNLAFRDPEHSPTRMTPVKTTHGTMQFQVPRKHVRQRAFLLDHLDVIFFGLATAIEALLRPSIISKEGLLRLHMKYAMLAQGTQQKQSYLTF